MIDDQDEARQAAARNAVQARFEQLMALQRDQRAVPSHPLAKSPRWADLREQLFLGLLLIVVTAAVVALTTSKQGDSCEPNPNAGSYIVDEICTDSDSEQYYR